MDTDYISLNSAQVSAEHDPFVIDRYRQFARHLRMASGSILDVGCSTGVGGRAMKMALPALSLIGLDCLQHRLNKLPRDVYSGAICNYSTKIDFADGHFDAIVAGEFIQNLTYGDGILTLGEFQRVLRAGGRLLMTTPYPDYIKLKFGGRPIVGGAHVSAHYPKQLAVMMSDAGFTEIGWCGSGRMSGWLGEKFPLMSAYGSFLIWGTAGKDALAH